jgi:hypothetical protein
MPDWPLIACAGALSVCMGMERAGWTTVTVGLTLAGEAAILAAAGFVYFGLLLLIAPGLVAAGVVSAGVIAVD